MSGHMSKLDLWFRFYNSFNFQEFYNEIPKILSTSWTETENPGVMLEYTKIKPIIKICKKELRVDIH